MRTFDELLDDLVYRARWERDEVESAKQTLRSMRDAAVVAERERLLSMATPMAEVQGHNGEYSVGYSLGWNAACNALRKA